MRSTAAVLFLALATGSTAVAGTVRPNVEVGPEIVVNKGSRPLISRRPGHCSMC
jgi:hypothetical protein